MWLQAVKELALLLLQLQKLLKHHLPAVVVPLPHWSLLLAWAGQEVFWGFSVRMWQSSSEQLEFGLFLLGWFWVLFMAKHRCDVEL
jgi:hypothetical protein